MYTNFRIAIGPFIDQAASEYRLGIAMLRTTLFILTPAAQNCNAYRSNQGTFRRFADAEYRLSRSTDLTFNQLPIILKIQDFSRRHRFKHPTAECQ